MKVRELKVGMILTPSLNKYTNLKPAFQILEREMSDGKISRYQQVVDVSMSGVTHSNSKKSYYDYAIYMGYEYSDMFLDGVKKHHMMLVGETLTKVSGYEFRYIEEAT